MYRRWLRYPVWMITVLVYISKASVKSKLLRPSKAICCLKTNELSCILFITLADQALIIDLLLNGLMWWMVKMYSMTINAKHYNLQRHNSQTPMFCTLREWTLYVLCVQTHPQSLIWRLILNGGQWTPRWEMMWNRFVVYQVSIQ